MKRKTAYPTLKDYIERESVNQGVLAKRVKITQSHMSLIISGQRTPSLPLAVELSRIANVPIESLVGKLHTSDTV
jgi:DNA-binding XRE family transcriptional regulator